MRLIPSGHVRTSYPCEIVKVGGPEIFRMFVCCIGVLQYKGGFIPSIWGGVQLSTNLRRVYDEYVGG